MSAPRSNSDVVPFPVAVRTWLLIALQSFGGPAGQIAVMQRVLVDELKWLGQRRFLHALNFCMLLPGPEAQQLAIYTGWLLNGLRGGLVAGTLFVLPGVVALLALSALYVGYGSTAFATSLLQGLSAAVIAVVVQAVIRVGRRALTSAWLGVIALSAFAALTLFALPFPAVIAVAGGLGWAFGRSAAPTPSSEAGETAGEPLISDLAQAGGPPAPRPLLVLAIGGCLQVAPVAAAALLFGGGSVFVDQGFFFSGAALVTFGGAYAVLAYVSHQAVSVFGWLTPTEMVRGLAFAETTPGPLIMVVQFVAFVGAYRDPGALNPWVAAVIGALLTTWVTFVPCFVFVLLGAPYVEGLRSNVELAAALSGITAAVVGVIANLALYFTLHTVFGSTVPVTAGPLRAQLPEVASFQPVPAALAALAAVLLFRRRWGVLPTFAVCAVAGIGASWAPGALS